MRPARRVGRPAGLLLALLVVTATLAACADRSADPTAPAASPAPVVATTMPPTAAAPAPTAEPSGSTVGIGALPRPVRELHQGDRLYGVYWVAASPGQLSPVERRLRALGLPSSSGELDCDQGARRWLGVPASITAKVAVYFGTEQDARAFAGEVPIRPRPHGHAAATLYCLD